ncbi:hypothetical protein BDZ91DRAFT_727505 [Kalaharituber pfeilii]|nr:hypothetical protein BDZ91DRAFT_727505 [Kalaharituber pfeilii]
MSTHEQSKAAGMTIFACGDCEARYLSSSLLKAHHEHMNHGPYKLNPKTGPVTCWDCSRTLASSAGLLSHQRALKHGFYGTIPKDKTKSYKRGICPAGDCTEIIKSSETMYQHLCTAHPGVEWWIVRPMATDANLDSHSTTGTRTESNHSTTEHGASSGSTSLMTEEYRYCANCNTTHDSVIALLAHQLFGRHGCPYPTCPRIFNGVWGLRLHLDQHPGFNWSISKVDESLHKLSTPPTVLEPHHVQVPEVADLKLSNFTCAAAGCSRWFSTAFELHYHEVRFHKLPESQQKSQQFRLHCSKNLQKHMHREHTPSTPTTVPAQPPMVNSYHHSSTSKGQKQQPKTDNVFATNELNKAPAAGFSCAVLGCSRRFTTALGLHEHEVNIHKLPKTQQRSQLYKLQCRIPGCKVSQWSEKKFRKHMRTEHPTSTYATSRNTPLQEHRCLDCSRDFASAHALQSHLKDKVHAVRPTLLEPPPNTCPECNKTFKTAAGLQSHLANSRKHKPISPNLKCIRPGCTRKFNSPSAMLHHLESGGCSPDIDIYAVNKVIMDNDPTGIITDAQASTALEDWRTAQRGLICDARQAEVINAPYLGGGGSTEAIRDNNDADDDDDHDGGGVQLFTPNSFNSASGFISVSSFAGEVTPTSYISGPGSGGMMTPQSIIGGPDAAMLENELALLSTQSHYSNGNYICPLCSNRRAFLSQKALESHLGSAAHAPKIFHCPTSLINGYEDVLGGARRKKKNHFAMFTTLSGLAQHLEAEACKGGRGTFEKVVQFVEARLKEMGLEGKLLM